MQIYSQPLTDDQKAAIARLADDMECGSQLTAQAHGVLMGLDWSDELNPTICTCAFGAALVCQKQKQGIEITTKREFLAEINETPYRKILETYGIPDFHTAIDFELKDFDDDMREIPAGMWFPNLVWKLNDGLFWSREQIAAWLRNLT